MIGSIYPVPPSDTPTLSGGTFDGDDIVATGSTVSLSRVVYPLFVEGSAGRLVWSCSVSAFQPGVLDASLDGTFRMTAGIVRASASRLSGPLEDGPVSGSLNRISAVLETAASDAPVTLQLVVECLPDTELTISQRWVQVATYEVGILPATPGFGDVSPNGVTPPPPSAGLTPREAASPARRSPQVRAAQRQETRRPDLLLRQSSLI